MLALTLKKAANGENEWISVDLNGEVMRVTANKNRGKIVIIFDADSSVKIKRENLNEDDWRKITGSTSEKSKCN